MNSLSHDVKGTLETALQTLERLETHRNHGMMDNADYDYYVSQVAFDTQHALEQALAVYARQLRSCSMNPVNRREDEECDDPMPHSLV